MPLREHLRELRRRLVLIALGLVLGAVAGWFLYEPVFHLLQEPVRQVAASRSEVVTLNFAGIATAFDMQVKVSSFLGVLLSSPWWLYQLWAFITPGLTRRERLYAVGFVAAAVPLFLAGAGLAWAVLPNAVRVLLEFTPAGTANVTDGQMYLSFVMRLMLAFGAAFLLPVVMVALNLTGLVQARAWAHGWRWAVVIAFAFAAVATPTPDVVTMLAVAFPICLLYGAALGVCLLHDRRVDRRLVAEGLPRLDGTLPGERARERRGGAPRTADAAADAD
ncbi:twin-arginine translocase subunit TatC [Cellulomonas shaoxiangyii]|uniref:Sec-independent protein translocase protein TatC n=1 Tax=Cellulomonas shaoxiangyii TaxID=2566013 RepID=A0A4P7SKD4_9CELL|nr:twin-arginine translocase subunit TatC [Cellulomonas shaoxiangyii]QCB93606.1 twin-arginine translocase subunit TatC [Cellulomonas shaoxiangyii]TGY85690.1 twin-arginine translocase subunit TatC [Cellulomonas shaoxiangyii]